MADGQWAVRLHVKPFVGWIWGGCVLMALGGVLAACDRRYRRRTVEVVTEAALPAPRPAVPLATTREPLR
ncbi:Cytochrome c-type biogenesis protein CcmF [compost metagenome]